MTIAIAKYYYHDLRNIWDRDQAKYVNRPLEGKNGVRSLFRNLEQQLDNEGVAAFVKPYLLFPSDTLANAVAVTHERRLSIDIYTHSHTGVEQYPMFTHRPLFFWDNQPTMHDDNPEDMVDTIYKMLDRPRTILDLPELAYVQITLESNRRVNQNMLA